VTYVNIIAFRDFFQILEKNIAYVMGVIFKTRLKILHLTNLATSISIMNSMRLIFIFCILLYYYAVKEIYASQEMGWKYMRVCSASLLCTLFLI
jgi:hypothetical protein